jgi:hypothetical protein
MSVARLTVAQQARVIILPHWHDLDADAPYISVAQLQLDVVEYGLSACDARERNWLGTLSIYCSFRCARRSAPKPDRGDSWL